MRVLFIGGTGVISSACAQAALDQGIDLTLLTRGKSFRPAPAGAHILPGDIRNEVGAAAALGSQHFDVVVDFIAYTPEQIETDLRLFRGRTGQYIFISTIAVYQTPPPRLPLNEDTPLGNPYWQYAIDKIACEQRLQRAIEEERFPATIVRPAHTYDCTFLPVRGGYTLLDRMKRGKPVIVHGDGTSLWTLTHHTDFARGFTALLGNPAALGEAVQITSDEILTWNQIYTTLGQAVGVEPKMVHVPSDVIAAFEPSWGASLLGDKCHSKFFDNTKIRQFLPGFKAQVPYAEGARQVAAWYAADPARQQVDPHYDQITERILAGFAKIFT